MHPEVGRLPNPRRPFPSWRASVGASASGCPWRKRNHAPVNLIIECRRSPVHPLLVLATIKIRGSSRYTSASSHAKPTRLTAPHREQCSEQILPPGRRATRSSRAAGSLSTRHTGPIVTHALSRHAAPASRSVHMGSPRTKRQSTSTNKQPSAGDHTPRRIPPSSTSTRGTARPSHSRA